MKARRALPRDGAEPGHTYGLDLVTGEQKVKFAPDRDIYFFHHRCHRGKATDFERRLLPVRMSHLRRRQLFSVIFQPMDH